MKHRASIKNLHFVLYRARCFAYRSVFPIYSTSFRVRHIQISSVSSVALGRSVEGSPADTYLRKGLAIYCRLTSRLIEGFFALFHSLVFKILSGMYTRKILCSFLLMKTCNICIVDFEVLYLQIGLDAQLSNNKNRQICVVHIACHSVILVQCFNLLRARVGHGLTPHVFDRTAKDKFTNMNWFPQNDFKNCMMTLCIHMFYYL